MPLKTACRRCTPFLWSGLWLGFGLLTQVAARAGGAGGRSRSRGRSSGGSWSHGSSSFGGSRHRSGGVVGSSDDGILFLIILLVVVVVIAIALYRTFGRKGSSDAEDGTALLEDDVMPDSDVPEIAGFLAQHPDIDLADFKAKVRSAFPRIQAAWSAQSLAGVRPFISDGVYQRFTTQFRMMELLRQRNPLDRVAVHQVQVVAARSDGPYEVIDVAITASAHDAFVCALDPSLDSESHDTFLEYWSFVRKRGTGHAYGDLYQDPHCPSCGAALPQDLGELCRCSFCQVMVNSGEFDWVLAEIIQPEDYEHPAAGHGSELAGEVARLAPECPDFSVQLIEDKAANAYMQIMTALATRNPAGVRRFVTDEVFDAVSAMIPEDHVIFSRIYLNDAVLQNVARVGSRHRLELRLAASMQRVELLPGPRLALIDADIFRRSDVLVLERDVGAVTDAGALYQHQCAKCGGRVGDTLDVDCQYCGTPLNSTRNEWIVTGFHPASAD